MEYNLNGNKIWLRQLIQETKSQKLREEKTGWNSNNPLGNATLSSAGHRPLCEIGFTERGLPTLNTEHGTGLIGIFVITFIIGVIIVTITSTSFYSNLLCEYFGAAQEEENM